MTLRHIREKPTVIADVHQSCYRSDGCLEKVKQMLEMRVPHEFILEVIDDLMNAPDPAMERLIEEAKARSQESPLEAWVRNG